MSNSITRRDILKFAGGGVLGVFFSPLPWKLLDDSAIWTQNWSLIPALPRGPITTMFSHCTLCSAGCSVKAQCVAGVPYYLSGFGGMDSDALHTGVLCPQGLAAHHMAHHPLRIVHPCKFAGKSDNSPMTTISLQDAMDEIAGRCKNSKGTIAILDRQPNRAISEVYRKFAGQLQNGAYLTSPASEESTIPALHTMTGGKTMALGYDFENAQLIVSFGAPILDNWGTPGRMAGIVNRRNETGLRIVQIDHRFSRTAMKADSWIAVIPGSERTLALALANALLEKHPHPGQLKNVLVDYSTFSKTVLGFSPESTAAKTGIDAAVVRDLAGQMLQSRSTITLSDADPGGGPLDSETEKIIAALNLLTGSIGAQGGIIERNEIPEYVSAVSGTRWHDIPDHSIEVLIVDGADSGYALPWQMIAKKLRPEHNVVVSLSPMLNDIAAHADFLIPGPACFESLTDIPTPPGSIFPTFSLAAPLMQRPEGTTEPIDVIRQLSRRLGIAMDIPEHEELIKKKVEALYRQRKGTISTYADMSTMPITDIADEESLWTALLGGAVWTGESKKSTKPVRFTVGLNPEQKMQEPAGGLRLVPFGWRGATHASQISPILSKIFQESELRDDNGTVLVNPVTAREYGLLPEVPSTLSTARGSMTVTIKITPSVRPGIIEAAVGPARNGLTTPVHPSGETVLNLCEINNDGTWRSTPVQFLKA
jgi:anaerobic selenocysteine-containing dehydrogenase